MLKTRVITALVLLVVIMPVLLSGSNWAVNVLCTLFLAAACWEGCRLFWNRHALLITAIVTALYIVLIVLDLESPTRLSLRLYLFFSITVLGWLAWFIVFVPALKLGLPKRSGFLNTLLGVFYLMAIVSCFTWIANLYAAVDDAVEISSMFGWTFLLSAMAIVWVADIGAYFCGKAWGRHLLAPTISPAKTWEGALGGWVCVLIVGAAGTHIPLSIFTLLHNTWGWLGLVLGLSFLTVVSVTGDLIESQLKRRAELKDSSQLLPGHGGVLDRIDALVFVIPMVVLIAMAALAYEVLWDLVQ